MATSRRLPSSEDVAAGFETTRYLIRDLLTSDREGFALLAVVSTRLDLLTKQVEHLEAVLEQGNGREPLIAQVSTLRQELDAAWRRLHALEERQPGTLPATVWAESLRGKWAAIATAITAASGVLLGLLNWLQ
jgi:hypothetical protein